MFYDRHGRPLGEQGGFDTVIGDSPTTDLRVSFFEQGVKLLREGGRLGYLVGGQPAILIADREAGGTGVAPVLVPLPAAPRRAFDEESH